MAKQPKGELVVVGFNYDLLETKVAEQARSSAERIRERVKKTVEDIIDVGNDLLAVKEALPHGHFGPWLKAEFGWSERSAQNFMSVAERFKSAKFADLPIQPSAAYLLAAPAVPDEARQVAVEKAEAGEEITFASGQGDRRRGEEEAATEAAEGRAERQAGPAARERRWSGTRSAGTRRNCPNWPASFGSSPTPWRSRRPAAGRRRRSDAARRGCPAG